MHVAGVEWVKGGGGDGGGVILLCERVGDDGVNAFVGSTMLRGMDKVIAVLLYRI